MRPSCYVTTPIYYVNDKPHIGHAYTTLAADVMARFKRLDGFDVMFLTGTDEHGQKIEQAAAKRGVSPQALTDQFSENFRHLSDVMGFSNDDFIRTTEDRHKRSCQHLWSVLKERGEIYLDKYAGWYAVRDEAFYAESELVDGKAPTGADVEWVEEPSYFFRLSAWGDRLLEHYERNPEFVLPKTRLNEVKAFVKGGLHDLSISRTTFNWGIPVPDDDAHIMYVWLDALTNYITALGYPDTEDDRFRRYWPAEVQFIGKDILRFHAVYWPAFLMAAGLEPPKRVFAGGWWTNEGQKISKSLGNVIDPVELKEKYGLDQVRYFLMREVPYGQDSDFSHKAMVTRMNTDLANDLGNLAQRVLSMVAKNCGGAVPERGAATDEDRALLDRAYGLLPAARAEVDRQAFHRYLEHVWQVIGEANRYIDRQEPWKLKKTDPARMGTVLWTLAETVRTVALLVQPVVPEGAARLLDQLAVPADRRDFARIAPTDALTPGTPLPKPEGVFPRWVEPETEEA